MKKSNCLSQSSHKDQIFFCKSRIQNQCLYLIYFIFLSILTKVTLNSPLLSHHPNKRPIILRLVFQKTCVPVCETRVWVQPLTFTTHAASSSKKHFMKIFINLFLLHHESLILSLIIFHYVFHLMY